MSGFAGLRPPRDEVLLLGLVDWVPLERVHQAVVDAHPDSSLPMIRQSTMDLIDELTQEGLFTIGDLTGENARFVPWSTPRKDSLQRIRKAYIEDFDNPDYWSWFCWLDLTPQGALIAQPIEDRLRRSAESSG
ncbi:hypothetical protein [Mycolicibacterium sphagni]|uniref:Uncharacterized protein n=1 Tax=Mycolicibacterium sphagni TaxID=1786 RepID=A0ABX2K3S2_9MYCO|nr:hypothetical protein [Mycolicibacterium sphagni]NTY63622.1 hypothetical protein [Mycolicibacterium sphagni]